MPKGCVESQMSLPFTYTVQGEDISEELSEFLAWGPSYAEHPLSHHADSVSTSKTAAPFWLHLRVAQRQASYSNAYRIQDLFPELESHLRRTGVLDETRPERLAPSDNSVVMPVVMSYDYDKNTKAIKIDVALAYYKPRHRSLVRRGHDKPFLRLWLHTEYIFVEGEYHTIDKESSWVSFCHDTLHPSFFKRRYSQIKSCSTNLNMIAPWYAVTVSILANGLPSYVTEWISQLQLALINHLKLNCLSTTYGRELIRRTTPPLGGDDVYHAWFIEGLSGDQYTNQDSEQNVILAALQAQTAADVFETIVRADPTFNIEGPANNKVFWKHFTASCQLLLENYAGENLTSWNFNLQIEALKRAYREFARVIELYGDVNFIKHVDNADIVHQVLVNRELGDDGRFYTDRISFIPYMLPLVSDEWFKTLVVAKQWRLIIEYILTGYHHEARDVVNMLTQTRAKDPEAPDEIPKRQIKCVQQLHDEVVKIYNATKHKPDPIPTKLVEWLTSYGLEIEGTKLRFEIPTNTNDIREWGQKQAHCLGSYAQQMAQGQTLIIGVWDEENGQWAGHMQLDVVPDKPTKLDEGAFGFNRSNVFEGTTVRFRQFYAARNQAVREPYRQYTLNHLSRAIQAWHSKDGSKPQEKVEV